MNHRSRAVLAFLGVVATSAYASAPVGPLTDYAVQSWTETDGLPSGSVWALAQDSDGYLWLGTNEGVVRFDGVRFVRWNALSRSPLPERRVMTLLSSADGSLWVGFGGSGGVSRIRNQEATSFDRQHGIAEDFIISLTEDRDGNIWAASPSGLYRHRDERWEKVGQNHGVPDGRISSVHEDRAGHLWIATTAGILRRAAGETVFRQIDAVGGNVSDITEDPNGTIWLTDPFVGLRSVTRVGDADTSISLLRTNGTRLLHDSRGNLWVGTFGQGLRRITSGATNARQLVQSITAGSGLSSDTVRALVEDREGGIWVGGDGGLSRLSMASVRAVPNLRTVRAVVTSDEGTVWAGTADRLIINPGSEAQREELQGANVSALHIDKVGTLWTATDQGLFRRVSQHFSRVSLPGPIRPERILAMTTDSNENLWLSDMGAGVFRLRRGQLTEFAGAQSQIGRRTAYALYTDSRDHVWVAYSGGMLAVVKPDGSIETYGPKVGGSLRTITEGRHNTIWVGGDDGLSRLSNGRFVTAGRKNGLPGNAVTAVVEDPDGNVWVGVHSGILRLNPSEFDALADNPDYQIRFSLYDRSDGLPGLPLWLGAPTAFGGSDARLWFVTGGGLAVVDSKKTTGQRLRPRARIESVLANESPVSFGKAALLPPSTQRLQIAYTAPGYVSSTKVRFRYRLEGYDEDWIEAGTRREALYTDLPPRTYQFRVVANTSEGLWTEAGAAWDFSVQPAFYQTNWFYRLLAILSLVMVWAGWQLRLRRIKRRFSIVLAERARVGRELHDTLLQSLVGVALQLEATSEKFGESSAGLKDQLRGMRMEVEGYVREARESIWDLRSSKLERLDLIAALRTAGERATNGAKIRFELTVEGTPQPCPPKLEEQLLRIAREAIQNSILHARATFIHLHLQYEKRLLRLRVADDGLGFDAIRSVISEGHYGLKSMQERAELVGGRLRIVSTPGKGTEIETVIPVSSRKLHNG